MNPETIAVTGASGYIGSRVLAAFERRGWCTIPLVRDTLHAGPRARQFALDEPFNAVHLADVDVLVHCAYDFSCTTWEDVVRVNIDGSERLLTAARDAAVRRIIVVSSMSAYDGTRQLYGSAKLQIEKLACAVGACVVRPGLVYGENAGGMAGALQKLSRRRLVPVTAGRSRQFLVHEDDLAACVIALATLPNVPAQPIHVIHPAPIEFRALVRALSPNDRRRRVYVPVPWQAVFVVMRAGELLGATMPFRSDSLLGLVRPAPAPVMQAELAELGIHPRHPLTALEPSHGGRT